MGVGASWVKAQQKQGDFVWEEPGKRTVMNQGFSSSGTLRLFGVILPEVAFPCIVKTNPLPPGFEEFRNHVLDVGWSLRWLLAWALAALAALACA